jgi:hypothetical protein
VRIGTLSVCPVIWNGPVWSARKSATLRMTGTACGPTSAPPLGNSPRLKTMMRALPPAAWTSTKRREISGASVTLSRSISGGTCRAANG